MSGRVTDILDELDDLAKSGDEVSVGDVMDKVGHRSSGVFLLVPGLIGASPLGGIPTLPSLMAAIVLIFAVQTAIGRKRIWMPAAIRERAVREERLSGAVDRMRGPGRFLDRHFGHRLSALTSRPAMRVAALAVIGLALTVPALEFVPFAAAIPMLAIALFGIAITLGDGILMAIAMVAASAALWGAWRITPFI
ncbi:exopolysaccharide biosynthesis protein [Palleronia rufa]|uniref:exopolysaccharide biosynthesis protein n=1 Tax=Palleronia rufa TaxID=1530186 RepID=UPI00056CA067|nr:exopolysaccharide biosynthesis protein [Palleronia rufa]